MSRQQFKHNPFPVFPSVAGVFLTDYWDCPFFRQRSRVFEMSDADGSSGQELCVLYGEAINWIAFRNFSGRAVGVGPWPLEKLPRFGHDDDDDAVEYGIDIGRRILAQELLLDYAAKGRIRVYANEGWTEDEASLSFPIRLTTEFLAKSEFTFEEYDGGPTLFITEEQGYSELAVHYGDLLREFWGNALPITIPETMAGPAPVEQAEPLHAADLRAHQTDAAARAMSPRGRRPKYAWPDFSAELLRRSISGPAIANQAALERHMLEWCAEKWNAEPAVSQIRDWVGPAYRMISQSSTADRTAKQTADNSSPKIAAATDG
jgi:hypothetical protein